MKWLVFGANGWIGDQIVNMLGRADQQVIPSACHFTYFEELVDHIQKVSPDRIVCAVGRTYGPGFTTIDYLEQPGKLSENLESNLLIPVWIAQAAKNIPILYFGTGCIFEYDEQHPLGSGIGFTEWDQPNFAGSSYSAVKSITDKIMGQFPHVLNARIRMPISDSWHLRDFITKIVQYKKITSILNSMTVLSDILPILLGILYEGKEFGTVNAVNPGTIEHKDILDLYSSLSGIEHEYELESIESQNMRLLSKRSNNELDTRKLEYLVESLTERTCLIFDIKRPLQHIQMRIVSIFQKRLEIPT